jgi:hypothetical protein
MFDVRRIAQLFEVVAQAHPFDKAQRELPLYRFPAAAASLDRHAGVKR